MRISNPMQCVNQTLQMLKGERCDHFREGDKPGWQEVFHLDKCDSCGAGIIGANEFMLKCPAAFLIEHGFKDANDMNVGELSEIDDDGIGHCNNCS